MLQIQHCFLIPFILLQISLSHFSLQTNIIPSFLCRWIRWLTSRLISLQLLWIEHQWAWVNPCVCSETVLWVSAQEWNSRSHGSSLGWQPSTLISLISLISTVVLLVYTPLPSEVHRGSPFPTSAPAFLDSWFLDSNDTHSDRSDFKHGFNLHFACWMMMFWTPFKGLPSQFFSSLENFLFEFQRLFFNWAFISLGLVFWVLYMLWI